MSVELIAVRRFSDGECTNPYLPTRCSQENLTQEDTSNNNTEDGQKSSVKTSIFYTGFRRVLYCCNYRDASLWSCAAQSAIILLVVSTMSISLLAFYTSTENQHSNMTLEDFSCFPNPYTGSICLLELQDWQNRLRLPDRLNNSDVLISSDVDQELREEQAEMLFRELLLLNPLPSDECLREFKSFWCLVQFGLCDGKRLPTCHQFEEMHNSLCANSICTELFPFVADMQSIDTITSRHCDLINKSLTCGTGNGTYHNITCSEQFFFEESSELCKPECGVWTQYSQERTTGIHYSIIAMVVLSVIICSAVLILSLIQHDKMFKFPLTLIIYQTLAVLIVVVFDFAHYLSLKATVCSSRDLVKSVQPENATGYCQFVAAIYTYALLFVAFLWLCHTFVFFWGVMWPMHYRAFTARNRIKYVHGAVLSIAIILPVIPVAAIQLSGGYGLNIYGYYFCRGVNPKDVFYAVVVPINTMLILGTVLLIIIAWNIIDVRHRCKGMKGCRRKLADLKVTIVILYYFFFTFFSVATATNVLKNTSFFQDEVKSIYECEALGHGEENCSTEGLDQFNANAHSYIALYVWLTLYPSIFFVYLIKCKSCRKPLHNNSLSVSHSLSHMTNHSTLRSFASLQNLNRISRTPVSMIRSKSVDLLV